MKNPFFIILILINLLPGCGKKQPAANNGTHNDYETIMLKGTMQDISGYCSNILFKPIPSYSCFPGVKNCASSDIIISSDQNDIYSTFEYILETIESKDHETIKNMVSENEDLLAQYINANFLKGVIDSELTMKVEKDHEINTNYLFFLAMKTKTIVYVCPIKLKSI